jgi:hypothetical protein
MIPALTVIWWAQMVTPWAWWSPAAGLVETTLKQCNTCQQIHIQHVIHQACVLSIMLQLSKPLCSCSFSRSPHPSLYIYSSIHIPHSLLPISSLDSGLHTLLHKKCIILSWIRKEPRTPFPNWTTHPAARQLWLHNWPALATAHYTIQDVFQMNLMLAKPCVVESGW